MTTKLMWLSIAVFGVTACAPGEGMRDAPDRTDNAAQQDRAPGEYVVTLRPHAGADSISRAYGSFGIRRVEDLGGRRYLIRLARDPGLTTVQQAGEASGVVETAQPNFLYHAR